MTVVTSFCVTSRDVRHVALDYCPGAESLLSPVALLSGSGEYRVPHLHIINTYTVTCRDILGTVLTQ